MGVCLKAVSHYFEQKKNFESLVIYLKLAFKIFVCIGVQGSQSILGGRTLSEFMIYFLMKSINRQSGIITPEQLSVLLDLYLESLVYLIHHINMDKREGQVDNQIILEAYDTLALFTIEFNTQNKQLFQILKEQVQPS